MLRSLKEIESYKVSALDGDIGKVTDFLFDDQHWTTRYLVTDTSGFWQDAHEVLISPISFRSVDWSTKLFHLGLTKEKIQNSPSVDLAKPVSRQYERDYSQYYGWPYYWGPGMTGMWSLGAYPYPVAASSTKPGLRYTDEGDNDPHLRSAKQVAGYHVQGQDGEIGHIADFIVDDETWTIRYLVIDTSNWWLGKKVLVAPHWVQRISWFQNMVYVDLTRAAIKSSPVWHPATPVDRGYEERLYDYYGRPSYWQSREVVHILPPQVPHLPIS